MSDWPPGGQDSRSVQVAIDGYGFEQPEVRYHWYTKDPFQMCIVVDEKFSSDFWTNFGKVRFHPISGSLIFKENDRFEIHVDVFVVDKDANEYGMVGSETFKIIIASSVGTYLIGGNPDFSKGFLAYNADVDISCNGSHFIVSGHSELYLDLHTYCSCLIGNAKKGDIVDFLARVYSAPIGQKNGDTTIGPIYFRKMLWMYGTPASDPIQIFGGTSVSAPFNTMCWSMQYTIPF